MGDGTEKGQAWRPPRRWVAHVDMDAFFASVEQLDEPQLRGLPVIVGNSTLTPERIHELAREARGGGPVEFIRGIRGVVASASYEARAFGVRSAMPLARALALCPDAVVRPGRFTRYREVAGQLRAIWSEFSPTVEPVSVDEAYLDMTGCELAGGPIEGVMRRLKARIREETGLTASVGCASSRLMSKIASDLRKPDGLLIVPHGQEARTLSPLSVRALPGVGPRTEEALRQLGITRIGDLAAVPREVLESRFGSEHAAALLRKARGIDNTPVSVPGDPKSISNETTLDEDTSDVKHIRVLLGGLADRVAWNLRSEGMQARCIYIKLRLLPADRSRRTPGQGFGKLVTRQVTLATPTDAGQTIADVAKELLGACADNLGITAGRSVVRLVGVGASSLVRNVPARAEAKQQEGQSSFAPFAVSLASDDAQAQLPTRHTRINASLDRIRDKYGFSAISLGTPAPRQPEGNFEE